MAAGWKDALMADTGAPWNIPYVEPADLVRDYPAADEAQALAIAAGLSNAVGLVAVKHALFTGTQSASVAAGGDVAVTDLEITHEVADAANSLIITAFLGAASNSNNLGNVGLAVFDGTNFLAVGAADGVRVRVSAGGNVSTTSDQVVTMPHITFVHTPGAGSITYTARALNIDGNTRTITINRPSNDTNAQSRARAVSALIIQEVRV
jgi:hypothetical protein